MHDMDRTVKVSAIRRQVDPVIYIGALLAIFWAATSVSVVVFSVFPSFGSSFWIALTGFALVSVIWVQAYVTLSGNRAEARRRVADKVQHYHELLKEHAYQEWVKASPIRMEVLTPTEDGKGKSLENLYLARPTFESLTVNDPDHSFGRDAISHLSAYPVVQPDPTIQNPLFGDQFRPYLQSVGGLVEGLGRYCEIHNTGVLEFSNWESESMENMAKECSLKLDRDERHFALAPESVSMPNLMKHLERQSQGDSRKLEAIARGETGGWDLRSTKSTPQEGQPQDFDVAASSSQDKLKQFKKLVTSFSRERARRIRPVNESLAAFEQAFNLAKQNMQIMINAVDTGTFEGKCSTEERLAKP